MKILLDECVDRRLALSLGTLDVRTVAELPFQQHLPKFEIAVILLRAKTNRLADLVALVPDLLAAVATAPKRVVAPIGR